MDKSHPEGFMSPEMNRYNIMCYEHFVICLRYKGLYKCNSYYNYNYLLWSYRFLEWKQNNELEMSILDQSNITLNDQAGGAGEFCSIDVHSSGTWL